ncbi:bleomycin resistance protein [Martelella lutilitoris]|uniref:Bleomycin resistance protein n=1 Tax=Martelella lutilitoris TaxID=2583532 RepID=A0A5C4JLK7_9HYPH|nr:VOC family protein [Martelella lutilitoris]TNB46218.1 bleomycin resistance protein [Martelella lutilitoris]
MPQPIALSGLHHVGATVTNLDASIAWYRETLGFELLSSYGWPGVRAAFIGRGDIRLELFQNDEAAPMTDERRQPDTNLRIGGIGHIALAVADLEEAVADLQGRHVKIVSPPREVPDGSGSRFAFIHDNEGMLVELFEQR